MTQVLPMNDKPTIFFDMDETLLHAAPPVLSPSAKTIRTAGHTFSVFTRPGIEQLLERLCRAGYQLYVFTAADPIYAQEALRATGLSRFFVDLFSTRGWWPRGRIKYWYLFDDTEAIEKCNHLRLLGPGKLIQVEAFVGNPSAAPIPVPQHLFGRAEP